MEKKTEYALYNERKKMLLISIIVPVYNVEKYLNRCIESILKQTYESFELILINDGSTDNSGNICDEYSENDNRIKVIHKENGGLSSARNAGIKAANGEHIVFVDSDDYVHEKMVEDLYKSIIENESDMALCNFTYVNELGDELEDRNVESPINNEILTSYDALNRLSSSKSWYYVIACNKLYKKTLFDDIEFPYGKCHEDEFVAHKIFDKCKTISCIKKPLYYYVQRSDSIMGKQYTIKRLDAVEAFVNRTQYFLGKAFFDMALNSLSAGLTTISEGYKNLDLKVKENRVRYVYLRKKLVDIIINNRRVFFKNARFSNKIKMLSFVLNMKLYVMFENIYRRQV